MNKAFTFILATSINLATMASIPVDNNVQIKTDTITKSAKKDTTTTKTTQVEVIAVPNQIDWTRA